MDDKCADGSAFIEESSDFPHNNASSRSRFPTVNLPLFDARQCATTERQLGFIFTLKRGFKVKL